MIYPVLVLSVVRIVVHLLTGSTKRLVIKRCVVKSFAIETDGAGKILSVFDMVLRAKAGV